MYGIIGKKSYLHLLAGVLTVEELKSTFEEIIEETAPTFIQIVNENNLVAGGGDVDHNEVRSIIAYSTFIHYFLYLSDNNIKPDNKEFVDKFSRMFNNDPDDGFTSRIRTLATVIQQSTGDDTIISFTDREVEFIADVIVNMM